MHIRCYTILFLRTDVVLSAAEQIEQDIIVIVSNINNYNVSGHHKVLNITITSSISISVSVPIQDLYIYIYIYKTQYPNIENTFPVLDYENLMHYQVCNVGIII